MQFTYNAGRILSVNMCKSKLLFEYIYIILALRSTGVDADLHRPDGMLGSPVHLLGFQQNKFLTGISPMGDILMPKSVEYGQ